MKNRARCIITNQSLRAKYELLKSEKEKEEKEALAFKPKSIVGYSVNWKEKI